MLSSLEVDFLLTNDDGIDAEGLGSLVRAIGQVGSYAVVAPDTVRSCCSHAVTTADALSIHRIDSRSWKVSGTPADCVRVAIKYLQIRPKWVLSGVNEGGNLGVDIHYSGTVAGAREATLMGFRAMALSQYLRRDRPRDWPVSALRAIHAWTHLRSFELPKDQFWNVNLPVVEHSDIQLPIAPCEPEPQMLAYDFAPIQEPIEPSVSSNVQVIKYTSNYQLRPRLESYDVAQCFGGNITASRLCVRLP